MSIWVGAGGAGSKAVTSDRSVDKEAASITCPPPPHTHTQQVFHNLPGKREGPGVRSRCRVWMGLGVFITKFQVWFGERVGEAPERSSLLTASRSAALG